MSQPAPTPNNLPAVWTAVIADMQARDAIGRERYGVPLQPCNGRNALQDMYEEHLDGLAYAKQALIERQMVRDLIKEAIGSVSLDRPAVALDALRRALELLPVGRKP